MCVFGVCRYVRKPEGRVLKPLELELPTVLRLLMWVLRTIPGPRQEQRVLLTTEPPLQLLALFECFLKKSCQVTLGPCVSTVHYLMWLALKVMEPPAPR